MVKKNKKVEQPNIPKVHKTVRELFYPTSIFFKDIENADEINKSLVKNIIAWKNKDEKGIVRSNSLGWHSGVDMHHRKEFLNITKELFKMQKEIYQSESYNPDTEPFCDNMWANVNYKHAHNRNHVHPGALWSGVYYVQTPKNCGRIWFTDPRGEAHMDLAVLDPTKPKPLNQWREVYYEPVAGRLIMFPGWLTHEVEPNLSDIKGQNGWRISISFNFKQRWLPDKYKPQSGGHDSRGILSLSDIK